MSKRPHGSQAPEPASEELVKRLRAAADDYSMRLQEIVESNDSASIAAAFAALLAGSTASAMKDSERPKKAQKNRPCPSMPAETFLEAVLFADRDTLDAMQGVCSFLLNFVRDRELTQLALRPIERVTIGKYYDHAIHGHKYKDWLPTIGIVNPSAGKEVAPKTVHQLTYCLRMAYCESVYIKVGHETDDTHSRSSDVWGMVFDDLAAPSTVVGTLDICLPPSEMELALRGIEAFKSVKNVDINSSVRYSQGVPLEESFLVAAAQRGVQHVENLVFTSWTNVAAALSFGFAKPTSGGRRSLRGVDCELGTDFLAQVKKKVGELCEAHDLDFTFTLTSYGSLHIDATGFEKYQRDDGRSWLMNDLDNHVNVDVKQTERRIRIHVFSSSV